MQTKSRGFTLIELLVVIAIIGILSAIVLASLNSARSRANDAKIQSQLSSIRGAAEIFYSGNGSYGTAGAVCTTAGSLFADTNSGMAPLVTISNYPSGTTMDCGNTASAYSVAAGLSSSPTAKFWCIDSTGVSRSKDSTGVDYAVLVGATGAHATAGATACR